MFLETRIHFVLGRAILVFAVIFATFNASYAQTCTALGPITSKDVIYQLLTDRFYNGDTTNDKTAGFDPALFDGSGNDVKLYQGGDWKGIEQHITYLQDMGISAVWISAPYSNHDTVILDYQADGSINKYTSYHGYHAHNYFATNKHLGVDGGFRSLLQHAACKWDQAHHRLRDESYKPLYQSDS
jgi:hypothetical protein